MKETKRELNIRRRLNAMLLFFAVAYLPFIIALSLSYDIASDSLSRIGWQLGGLNFLLVYVLYTVPFMIYQVSTFLVLAGKKNRLLKALIIISGAFLAVGAMFPVKESSPQYSHVLHSVLSQAGSALSIIAVTYMVSLFCKGNDGKIKMTAILYALLLVVIGISFHQLFTAALFEAGASFLFLGAMYLINLSCHKSQETKRIREAEHAIQVEVISQKSFSH